MQWCHHYLASPHLPPAADIQGDLCFVSAGGRSGQLQQSPSRYLQNIVTRTADTGTCTTALSPASPVPLSLSSTDLVSIVTSFNYLCPIPGLAQGPGAGGGVTLCFPGSPPSHYSHSLARLARPEWAVVSLNYDLRAAAHCPGRGELLASGHLSWLGHTRAGSWG